VNLQIYPFLQTFLPLDHGESRKLPLKMSVILMRSKIIEKTLAKLVSHGVGGGNKENY
jgi:hypothetical protein